MILFLLLTLLGAAAPDPGNGPGPARGSVTGLPLPRFVSLRSDEVNVRAGPGFQYPVNWVYQRKGLPVEIIEEFNVWRQILAPDGGTGWVHEATIRARRGFYVTSPKAPMLASPNPDANVVSYLTQGVSGVLLRCTATSDYCKIEVDQHTGYLNIDQFWGAFPHEVISP